MDIALVGVRVVQEGASVRADHSSKILPSVTALTSWGPKPTSAVDS
jgi:hypothetical protein